MAGPKGGRPRKANYSQEEFEAMDKETRDIEERRQKLRLKRRRQRARKRQAETDTESDLEDEPRAKETLDANQNDQPREYLAGRFDWHQESP